MGRYSAASSARYPRPLRMNATSGNSSERWTAAAIDVSRTTPTRIAVSAAERVSGMLIGLLQVLLPPLARKVPALLTARVAPHGSPISSSATQGEIEAVSYDSPLLEVR